MQARGGNQPHNNMPPYVVLRACKRIKDNQLASSTFNFTGNITSEWEKLKFEISTQKFNITTELDKLDHEIDL